MLRSVSEIAIVLIVLCAGCHNNKRDCSVKKFEVGSSSFEAHGCLKNNLENGYWIFYDKQGKITEEGNFEDGIRQGEWKHTTGDGYEKITWVKEDSTLSGLAFSIPSFLYKVDDDDEFVKYSNKDTSGLVSVVLSVHNLPITGKNIDNYYVLAEEEVNDMGWGMSAKREKKILSGKTIYFNQYLIDTKDGNYFEMLNIYTPLEKNRVFEFTCRFPSAQNTAAKIIFFSMLTNCFLHNTRIVDPFQN